MTEEKCECKFNSVSTPSAIGVVIAYELAAVIIVLLLIKSDLGELLEEISLVKGTKKEVSSEE